MQQRTLSIAKRWPAVVRVIVAMSTRLPFAVVRCTRSRVWKSH